MVLCDIWGVVHDGVRAYPDACLALGAFRRRGGSVVLISNAPSTTAEVAILLDRKQVPRDSWDAIVTSGDLTRLRIEETGVKRIFHIGATRGEHVFEGLGVALVEVQAADAIVATELTDYYSETPEDYRDVLQEGVARRLPFICANPDLVVHVGDDLLPCAGALAVLYEQLGGMSIGPANLTQRSTSARSIWLPRRMAERWTGLACWRSAMRCGRISPALPHSVSMRCSSPAGSIATNSCEVRKLTGNSSTMWLDPTRRVSSKS